MERKYGLGRKRTDLLLIWFYEGSVQKTVIELKILHKSLNSTIQEGLEQTWSYMDLCGTTDGHLVIFDRRDRPWEEKIFNRRESFREKEIFLWGM